MKFINSIKYIFVSMFIYMMIFVMELFTIRHLIDGLSDNYIIKLVIYAGLLLIINPILAFFISEKLPFNPEGLKAPNGLEGALNHKIELYDEDE